MAFYEFPNPFRIFFAIFSGDVHEVATGYWANGLRVKHLAQDTIQISILTFGPKDCLTVKYSLQFYGL
jgi:hypothetical protein